jgi:hypothetical protein
LQPAAAVAREKKILRTVEMLTLLLLLIILQGDLLLGKAAPAGIEAVQAQVGLAMVQDHRQDMTVQDGMAEHLAVQLQAAQAASAGAVHTIRQTAAAAAVDIQAATEQIVQPEPIGQDRALALLTQELTNQTLLALVQDKAKSLLLNYKEINYVN